MGAANALAAYRLYAGRVPPLSMQLLAYMALVSKDDDKHPWYGQGYEALAVFALGRQAPLSHRDLEAVRRGMKALLDIGAVVTDRRASPRRDGPKTARYRLQLVPLSAESIDETLVDNPSAHHGGQPERPTESVQDDPRNPCNRPTESVQSTHGIRGSEEPRGTTRSETEENHPEHQGESLPSTARPARANEKQTDTDTRPAADPDTCPGCGVLLDPDRVCRHRPCPHHGARLAPVRHLPTTAA